jgi:hypothetical protein
MSYRLFLLIEAKTWGRSVYRSKESPTLGLAGIPNGRRAASQIAQLRRYTSGDQAAAKNRMSKVTLNGYQTALCER